MSKDKNQEIFNRYINYAMCWIADALVIEPVTNRVLRTEELDQELRKIEQHINPDHLPHIKDGEPVNFRKQILALEAGYRAVHNGQSSPWNNHKIAAYMIEKAATAELTGVFEASTRHDSRAEGYLIEAFKAAGVESYWEADHGIYKARMTFPQALAVCSKYEMTLTKDK